MTSSTQAGGWVERAQLFHSLACEYAEEKDDERSAHWTAAHHALLVEQAALTERLANALDDMAFNWCNDMAPGESPSLDRAKAAIAAYRAHQKGTA